MCPTPQAENIFLYLNRLEINNNGTAIIKLMKQNVSPILSLYVTSSMYLNFQTVKTFKKSLHLISKGTKT